MPAQHRAAIDKMQCDVMQPLPHAGSARRPHRRSS